MTAAASPREATTTRPSRTRMPANGLEELPVLLRLPSVGSNNTAKSRSSQNEVAGSATEAEVSPGEESTRRGQRGGARNERVAESPSTKVTAGSKVLGLLWRVGVVAAAIALIVLAYRIINGPPAPQQAAVPGIADMPAIVEAPGALPLPDATAGESDISPMPTIVTPDFSVSEHEALLPTGEASESGSVAADQHANDSHLHRPGPVNEGNDSTSPTPSFATVPRTTPPADVSAAEASDWSDVDSSRPWADDDNFSADDVGVTSWDNATADFGDSNTASYPQSDRSNWRTAEQWFLAAEAAAREEQQVNPTWQDSERSAARLRPEIEQPPLPRDNLR